MVRSSAYRASKYAGKLVGDVIKNRIDAQRDSMISQATTQFGLLESIETGTKTILNTAGVDVYTIPAYLAFSRAAFKIKGKHSGAVQFNELCILFDKWAARNLTEATLAQIILDVHGVDISSCT